MSVSPQWSSPSKVPAGCNSITSHCLNQIIPWKFVCCFFIVLEFSLLSFDLLTATAISAIFLLIWKFHSLILTNSINTMQACVKHAKQGAAQSRLRALRWNTRSAHAAHAAAAREGGVSRPFIHSSESENTMLLSLSLLFCYWAHRLELSLHSLTLIYLGGVPPTSPRAAKSYTIVTWLDSSNVNTRQHMHTSAIRENGREEKIWTHRLWV